MPRKRTSPIDTHPSALQQQVEMLREATCAQRFAAVRSLSATVASLSRRALRRNMPDAPENEIDLAFVALHYGDALAARVRARSERGT